MATLAGIRGRVWPRPPNARKAFSHRAYSPGHDAAIAQFVGALPRSWIHAAETAARTGAPPRLTLAWLETVACLKRHFEARGFFCVSHI